MKTIEVEVLNMKTNELSSIVMTCKENEVNEKIVDLSERLYEKDPWLLIHSYKTRTNLYS